MIKMAWEFLEIANFILGCATLSFTVGVLFMLRRADEVLLRAKLFLDTYHIYEKGGKKGFIYQTWYYVLGIAILITIHSIAWLVLNYTRSETALVIYSISKTLFIGLLCLLAAQWFAVTKECLRKENEKYGS